jgi:hypothetical protein
MIRTSMMATTICLALVMPSTATAQLDTFIITDGEAQFEISNLDGGAEDFNPGQGNMRTQLSGTATDHLFQNWFWIRTTGDSRERALSNQVAGSASGNRARLVYSEPTADGATPNAVLVELEYTIHDLGLGGPPNILLVIGFKIRNLTGGNLNVQLFHYNDFDLAASAGFDSAVVTGVDDQTQIVTDGFTRAAYSCSATNHINYEIGVFPALINVLTDPLADNLGDIGSPFGPGDYTGANQWGTTLGGAGNALDTLVGSVAINITRDTCPSDTNGDGVVNTDDLVKLVLDWGECPE